MFFRPNNALLLAGTKRKSTYKSLELTTAIRLPTVIHHTLMFYDVIKGLRNTIKRQQRLNRRSINRVVNQYI